MALRSLTIVFLFFVSMLFAEGSEEGETKEMIVLPKNAVINSDYFAHGQTVEISGMVNGDVYISGGQVFIDGIVNGNILVAGGSVEISGKVSKSVRLLAGQVLITGEIRENITVVAATVEMSPSSHIGRNVIIVSGNTDLGSKVGNNVHLYSSNVRLSSHVQGKVLAYIGRLRITSKAMIGRGLEYWSNDDALIDSHAEITEGVFHHPSFFYNFVHSKVLKGVKIGSKLAALFMNFFYSFIIGLVMMRYFPSRIEKTIGAMNHKPIQSLVTGGVLLFLLPITMLVLIITILGVPFALALLSLTVVGLYTAKIFSVLWLSTHLFRKLEFKRHRRLYFSFGLILYFMLTLIPYLGPVVTIASLLFGIGGATLSKMEKEVTHQV